MNPRDFPEVVAELIIEMHEVRSHLQAVDGRLDRVETELRGMREDIRALPEQIGTATIRALEPFLLKILDHRDTLKDYEQRLNRLENPATE